MAPGIRPSLEISRPGDKRTCSFKLDPGVNLSRGEQTKGVRNEQSSIHLRHASDVLFVERLLANQPALTRYARSDIEAS